MHLHESYAEAEPFRATHNIVGLWNTARDPLARLDLCPPELDRRVRRALEPFAELDRSAAVFRYPVTQDGSAAIAQEHLNIGAMRDAALALLDDLEALAGAVGRDTELRYEAMVDAAQAWWYGLSEAEREEYERQSAELDDAYLEGHI